MVLLGVAMAAIFALVVGLLVGYATGSDEQRAADQAEIDSLTEQVDALDHVRHLGPIEFAEAARKAQRHPTILAEVTSDSWFDLFNRADVSCEMCDGLGRVPCPCTREAR